MTTTVRPSRVRATDSSRSSSMVTPAAAHLSTISLVPVDASNHSITAAAIVGPTPSAAASSRLGRGPDRLHRAELGGQRPGGRRARRAGSTAPPAPATAGTSCARRGWRAVRCAVGAELRPVLALLGRAGEQVGLQQLVAVEVEDVALVRDHAGVEQRVRRLGAEPLDVERPAAGDVVDPLEQLGRARRGVGAAEVLVALLLLDQRGAARRALGRHHPLRQALGPQRQHRADDLGDHVAGLAQDDGVAGADVLALDLVGVVQRRPLDRRAGDLGRLHHPERRHPAGAAGVDLDREELGVDLLGRVLERDRPPRRAAGRARAGAGARRRRPSPRRRRSRRATIECRCSPAFSMYASTSVRVGTTRTWSEIGSPHASSAS